MPDLSTNTLAALLAGANVGDRVILCSDDLPEVEVSFRGLDDAGRAVVIMNGYQIAVDPRRLRALPSDDDEDDL